MKLFLQIALLLSLTSPPALVVEFTPAPSMVHRLFASRSRDCCESQSVPKEEQVNKILEKVAHTLRLQTYDVTAGNYGFESKCPTAI